MPQLTVPDYFRYATLATASYVRMGDKPLTGQRFAEEAAEQGRLPIEQAQYFFDPTNKYEATVWSVLSYYGGDIPASVDPNAEADRSGFGATLFSRTENGQTEKVLALRGTEPTEDGRVDLLSADLAQIGILGLALTQVVSMANYVARLRETSGVFVRQLRVEARTVQPGANERYVEAAGDLLLGTPTVYFVLTDAARLAGLGEQAPLILPDERVRVTGHSLGGHLAYMAARLFPEVFDPEVIVFNAAGYDPDAKNLARLIDAFTGVVQKAKSSLADEVGPAAHSLDVRANQLTNKDDAKVLRLIRDGLYEDFGFTQGVPSMVSLRSEDLLPGDDAGFVASRFTGADKYGTAIDIPTEHNNHVIEPLMDALALQAAIEPMRGTLFSSNDLVRVLEAGSNNRVRSYEAFAEALYRLFLGTNLALPDSDESFKFSDIVPFIGKGAIEARNAYHDAVLRIQEALKSQTGLKLFSLADMSADSLKNLAVNGDVDAMAYRYALENLNPFAVFGPTTLYQPHNENGELNLFASSTATPAGMTRDYLSDRTGLLQAVLTANTLDNTTGMVRIPGAGDISTQFHYYSGGTEHVLFADPGIPAPSLRSQSVQFADDAGRTLSGFDFVLGDRLYGGMGMDVLIGGKGGDRLEGGAGFDIYQFNSGDGADEVLDTDGKGLLRYSYTDSLGVKRSTVIAEASVQLNALTWTSADEKFVYTKTPNSTGGTDLVVSFSGDASSSITLQDFRDGDFGIRLGGAVGDAFRIQGDGRNNGFGRFASGSGFPDGTVVIDDNGLVFYYVPTTASVILEGLGGLDSMEGGAGADRLFAGSEADLANLDELMASGQRGEFLSGNNGADALVGREGNDLISGGNGNDRMLGGPGDDYINDDLAIFSLGADWSVTAGTSPFEPLITGGVGNLAPTNGSGEDVLMGGAGNDWLFAGAGVDVIFGGEGNDIIGGGGDDDFIFGGEGNDLVQADAPYRFPDPVTGNFVDIGNDFVDGEEGNDRLYGLRGGDRLFGSAGDDELYGDRAFGDAATPPLAEHGRDYLDGGEGNDKLYGDGGDDILVGARGSDKLDGGAGDDIYVFNRGDGEDTLTDESGNDTVRFGEGIKAETLNLTANVSGQAQNLVIGYGDEGDSITLLGRNFGGIERFEFADGTVFDGKALAQATGGMTLLGSNQADTLDGRGDYVLLAGGAGDDQVRGGSGSTVYLFNLGDGADFVIDDGGIDTFVFGGGIVSNMLQWSFDPTQPGARFTLSTGRPGDEIAILDGEKGVIEKFRFDDGTEIGFDELIARQGGLTDGIAPSGLIIEVPGGTPYVVGSAGPDIIFDSDEGHVTYAPGPGDDYLEIYQGDNYRYVFNLGDGNDVIWTDNAADTIVFGSGITAESIRFAPTTQSYRWFDEFAFNPFPIATDAGLKISYGSRGDAVFVVDGDGSIDPIHRIETFEFADGRSFSYQEMLAHTPPAPLTAFEQAGAATDEEFAGGEGNDVFDGGGGRDILQGGAGEDELHADLTYSDAGNDLLDGGAGFDYLDASLGNDLLIGGTGDDLVYSDVGNDVVLFNRGDGHDEYDAFYSDFVAPALRADTLSLGGGIRLAEIALSRRDSDLYVETGQGDMISLYAWYDDSEEDRTVSRLQVIAGASADYDPDSADPMLNQRVQVFDFAELARQFDLAYDTDPGIERWYVAPALPGSAYLGASDSAAYGGDIAYRYGTAGSYAGMPTAAVRATLTDGAFGALQPFSAELLAEIANPTPGALDFALGAGSREIENLPFASTLRVQAGITAADLRVSRDGGDLLLTHVNGTDQLRISGWYAEGNAQWLSVLFADGTRLSPGQLTEAGLTVHAGPEGAFLEGLPGHANTLLGGAGNDALAGGYLADVLAGGPGDDLLAGGAGDDEYHFNAGDGVDTIVDTATESGPNSVVFGPGITPEMLTLGIGSFLVRVGSGGDAIRIATFDPEDARGAHGVEHFIFADSPVLSYQALLERGFDLAGTEGDDTIIGTNIADRIDGGAGDDLLAGGLGGDTYLFGAGAGQDRIIEAPSEDDVDTLRVLANPGEVTVTREGDDLVVSLNGTADRVAIDWFSDPAARLEQVRFADDSVWDAATLESHGEPSGNQPPQLANPLADQTASEDAPFAFAVPGNTFSDPDAGDALTYAATRTDGSALPAWLGFDPLTGTFSGTPLNADVGSFDVHVTATDSSNASVSDVFTIAVANTNDAPTLAHPIEDQSATEDAAFGFTMPADTFADVDVGDSLTYAATRADGTALPAWLGFDPLTGTFSGTPLNADVGSLDVKVTATDGSSAAASDVFTVTVANTNDAPVLANAIPDWAASEDHAFSFSVPAGTFADMDAGDTLSYSASRADGTPLPEWLSFNSTTQEFSGTPLNADVGSLDVKVTATDGSNAFASDVFTVTVANTNDAPQVAVALADWAFDAGSPFVFALPAGSFVDPDGESLALAAGLFDGGALPAWLGFDAASGTFTGNPRLSHIGISHIAVTASDASGEFVTADFGLVVRAVAGSKAIGSAGDDVIYGNTGDEILRARGGSDYLFGDLGDDLLRGGGGEDVLQGGAGSDVLRGGLGQNVLDGGEGEDLIHGGAGSGFIAGGRGNDTLRVGTGNDLISFNLGDGSDTLYGGRDGGNTLSLGGGIRYQDLNLSKSGKDLILQVGASDQMVLKNWYGGNRSVSSLQIVLDATDEYDPASADGLYNRKVQTFDFLGLVRAFNQARAATPGLSSWAVTNALLQFHLSGADDFALGGDLAYWYAKKGNLSGISLAAAQQAIGAAGFGAEAQSLHPFAGLQEGFVKLA